MEIIGRKEALEKGLKRYFTGKPCKRGHISERNIWGTCVQCRYEWENENKYVLKTKANIRYLKNSERSKENAKKWAFENSERRKEIVRNYRERNPDKVKESQLNFKKKNPGRAQEIKNSWAKRNPEKQKEARDNWRKENPGVVCAYTRKRQAQQMRATPPWLTKEDLDSIKLVYIEAAERSQRDGIQYHVDHIVPLQGESISGLHVLRNLQILKASDNISKSNRYDDM